MKKALLLLSAAVSVMSAGATETWTLTKSNKVYQVDTIQHVTVGPGTTETTLRLEGEYKMDVFILTVDMTNPNVELRALKAGDNRSSLGTVPQIAKAHDVEGEVTHFAGVNSDFFDMSSPYYTNGNCISNYSFISPQNAAPWAHWMIDGNRKMTIAETTTYNPYLTFPNGGGTIYFYVDPDVRTANRLCIYTGARGSNTGTNKWGSECVIEPVDGNLNWSSKPAKWRVVTDGTVPNTTAGMDIPAGKYVLSGNGTAATSIGKLKAGDIVEIGYYFKADGVEVYPAQMSGGEHILLKDGVHVDVSSANAPRTAIGYNADQTKVVMMVVDGRSDRSDGAYFRMMAALMEKAGCRDALEFDGGGSSTLYLNHAPGNGIINVPSEGTPRRVACGLYAAHCTPADDTPASIEVKEKNIKLSAGDKFKPTVHAYNRHGVLIDQAVEDFTIEAPATLGTVSADGKTLTANGQGYQPLTVRYGTLSTVVPVKLPGNSGVENVVAEPTDPEVEYYNLQGLRVVNPQGGIFIRRQGNSVTKVIM